MKKMFTLLSALFIGAMATAQVTVTFQVDVTNYLAGGAALDPTGIRVGGNFSTNGGQANGGPMADWSPTTATSAMTDMGNNVWQIVVDFPATAVNQTLLYKFINGNWGMNEGTDPANTIVAGGCGVDDGSGNINRTLVIPGAATTVTYCWDACAASCSANLIDNAISNLVVSPNPANDVVTFNFNANATNAEIVLFDLSGKVVATKSVATGSVNAVEISTSNLMAGSYLYQVKAAGNVVTGKLMKK
jgi:hypothetical protein